MEYRRNVSPLWRHTVRMLHGVISCAKSAPSAGRMCGHLQFDITDPAALADQAAKQLAENGWTVADGEHYCPRHNPTDAGALLEIRPVVYVPVGDSGWEIRLPETGFALGEIQVEVRRRPDTAGGGDD